MPVRRESVYLIEFTFNSNYDDGDETFPGSESVSRSGVCKDKDN